MVSKKFITRVEGHGNLKIDFKKNKAKIIVEEEERLFEQLVINYSFKRAPFITARICGICPTAHYLAAIKAVEDGFSLKPPETAVKLREILLAGQIVQSHTLHLFFLVLPDYTKTKSVKTLAQQYPAEFHLGLNLKKVSDKLVKLLGGREVHPLTPQVGGFKKAPSFGQLKKLSEEIKEVLDEAQDAVRLFNQLKLPSLEQEDRQYLSLDSPGYPLYQGERVTNMERKGFKTRDYQKRIKEEERAGTLVKFSKLSQKGANSNNVLLMVGALTRLNSHQQQLNQLAQQALSRCQMTLPSSNPFDNIKAQAIELIHYLAEAKEMIDNLKEVDLKKINVKVKPKAGLGVGAVEAPRGTLYHSYRFNQIGEIIKADIITPTAQNMLSLEADADRLINLYQDRSQAKREKLIEQLVRAYDPCLTCSVH
jgi:sulfhydrogenase subunit alpha